MRCFVCIVVLLFVSNTYMSQDFVNGDLEGVYTNTSVIPPEWYGIPWGGEVCQAIAFNQATADLTDIFGPAAPNGVLGNPYSGNTFVSGLFCGGWHEGIAQSVSGFTIGESYTIYFHQAVVKQPAPQHLRCCGITLACDTCFTLYLQYN